MFQGQVRSARVGRVRSSRISLDALATPPPKPDSPEDELAQIQRGMKVYERLLGARPTVYGRRRYGLAPWMPQLLSRFGFDGALHFTLDDGQFAKDEQGKVQWEGLDGSTMPAVARVGPTDAS